MGKCVSIVLSTCLLPYLSPSLPNPISNRKIALLVRLDHQFMG